MKKDIVRTIKIYIVLILLFGCFATNPPTIYSWTIGNWIGLFNCSFILSMMISAIKK